MNSFEKIPVFVYDDDKAASRAVARRIAQLIREKSVAGKHAVLGLATGHTPVNVYKELIRLHREEGLDFTKVITFNLDEYWPILPDAIQSYYRWMHENLFNHINIPKANVHIPDGTVPGDQVSAFCLAYEQAIKDAGGIDLQVLGVGRSGHIGFNEPGSGRDSITRQIHLDNVTRKDAASDFFGEENVPLEAITMGVGTILAAKEICLMAFGEHKAPVIKRAVEGDISLTVAASFLQQHANARIFLDEAAAAALTRFDTPWLLGSCQWDDKLKRKAVLWLSQKVNKPILMLTGEDYAENGLYELLQVSGGYYQLNIDIFKSMMKTVTGKPGGHTGPKKIVIFSPHPDDDVISMGGTIARLVEQGHQVHAVYMVSGCLSIFDHEVARYTEFVREFNEIFGLIHGCDTVETQVEKFLQTKPPGTVDTPEVQRIKGLIRRTEAVDAAKFCGVPENQCHFLELPFYNTGKVQKMSITQEDIGIVLDLLRRIGPDIVFAAGDMSDPHGTHRMCLDAVLKAFEQYGATGVEKPELWLYRGAWQEWSPEQIEMAVPMAPEEVKQKRFAIFRHQSQKDRAMFPGPYDSREFWQRAEERNADTAKIYDKLGLPQYFALEAFVRYPITRAAQLAAQLER